MTLDANSARRPNAVPVITVPTSAWKRFVNRVDKAIAGLWNRSARPPDADDLPDWIRRDVGLPPVMPRREWYDIDPRR